MRGKTPIEVSEQATAAIDAVSRLDYQDQGHVPPLVPSEPGRYLEIQGPLEATLVPLKLGIMHIGRGLSADLRLDDTSVSRRHAILVNRPTGVRVLDDRSSFGTVVNGRRVTQSDLQDGDVLTLGRVVLRYLDVTESDLQARERLRPARDVEIVG